MQQVRPAGGEEFHHLLSFDGALQDDAAGSEFTAALRTHGLFAQVRHRLFEHTGTAFGAGAQGMLSGEIRRFPVPALSALTEVELRLHLGCKLERSGKRSAHAAAKPCERPHGAFFDQLLNFLGRKFASRHHAPDGEVAGLALELAVVFLHRGAALRTRRTQCRESLVGDVSVADALDHFASGIDNMVHEDRAFQFAALHLLELVLPAAGKLR